jgi:hypothetical protein
MFLGNPATTMKALRSTLRAASQAGLGELFERCFVIRPTRVYDYENPTEALRAAAFSIQPDLRRTSYRQLLPSFAYPPALLDELGSAEEIDRLFEHLGETYLSTQYRHTRDWITFLQDSATPAQLADWLSGLPAGLNPQTGAHRDGQLPPALEPLFSGSIPEGEREALNQVAEALVEALLSACLGDHAGMLADLGFPASPAELGSTTPYELAAALYSRYRSESEIRQELASRTRSHHQEAAAAEVWFCLQALLHRFNVRVLPAYAPLFIEQG